jgi:hypothetical protein
MVPREKVWFIANSIVIYLDHVSPQIREDRAHDAYLVFGLGGFGYERKPGKEMSSQPGAPASRRASERSYCARRPGG